MTRCASSGISGGAVTSCPFRAIVADRSGLSVCRIFLMLKPVRVCASRDTASAAKTTVRWASMDSQVWWKIGYADLWVMPTPGVGVQVSGSGGAERSA